MEGAKLVNSFINEMKIDRAIGFRMRAPAIQMFATVSSSSITIRIDMCVHEHTTDPSCRPYPSISNY